jgi:competence protein ComEA
MRRASGTLLLVAVLLSIILFRFGRVAAFFTAQSPAFYVNIPGYVTVFLGQGFRNPGYHHFFDGAVVGDVIQMASSQTAIMIPASADSSRPLDMGEGLEIVQIDSEVAVVSRFFVHAGQRITLGIPLHPDTMKASDWQALPGIGPCLADRIEKNRQKNGEFADIEAVKRVSGVGEATIRRS